MFTNKLLNDSLAEAVKKVMKDEESGLRMAAHAAHKSGKKMFTFQGKTYPVKVQGEEVSFGEAIEEAKDCVTEPKAKEIAKKEVKSHETQHHGEKGDVAKHVKKMHKEETFKDRLIESAYGKKSPMIDEDDSEMTPEQKKKKEKIVLSMKDKEKEFKAKYGKNWKSVMYATATKLAMKEDFDPEQLEEVSKVEVDKFHKKLDTLVHSSFGKSSKEKKMKEDVEQIDEVGDTEKGRQALTKLIGARVQDPKGKHGLEGAKRALKRLGPARRLRGEEVEQIDEKNKSHTHAAHYENDKGEWVGMNLLVAKDDNDAISQAHEKCKEGCRLSRVERHIPVKESTDDDVPFAPDKKKSSANVTDKSGAHHTAMSRVRHLAKQAIEKQKKMKKEMIGKAGMTSEETNEE